MTWVRLDDVFPENAKVAPLSDPAFRLHIEALCCCSRNRTNGRLSEAQLHKLGTTQPLRHELTSCRLWKELKGGGVVIHDYLKYNPSRAEVEARREASAVRVQEHRKRKRNASVTVLQVDPVTLSPPGPSHPVPIPSPEDPDPTPAADPRPDRLEPIVTVVPQQPQRQELVKCPKDLELTEDQVGMLEVAMIPRPAIAFMTRRFVLKAIADPTDVRTLATWRKACSVAVSGNWNNAKIRDEYLRAPAPGLLEHERRGAAPAPSSPRPKRRPDPPPLSREEQERCVQNALTLTERKHG